MKLEDGDYVVKDGKLYKPTLVEVKESEGCGCLIFIIIALLILISPAIINMFS